MPRHVSSVKVVPETRHRLPKAQCPKKARSGLYRLGHHRKFWCKRCIALKRARCERVARSVWQRATHACSVWNLLNSSKRQAHGRSLCTSIGTNLHLQKNVQGQIKGDMVQLSYPGNRSCARTHYDPQQLAVFTADRASVRLLLILNVHMNLMPFHDVITAAFLHELYGGSDLMYVHQVTPFDGREKQRYNVVKICRNIYGTPNASRVYADGLHKHLWETCYLKYKRSATSTPNEQESRSSSSP